MEEKEIIEKTQDFVKEKMKNFGPSHDFQHIVRVYNMAVKIGEKEKGVDMLIIKLGALLHDINDYKNIENNDNFAETEIFLGSLQLSNTMIEHLKNIINYVSFSEGLNNNNFKSKELDIIKDADKIDAIGAVGIARCMCYTGEKGRKIFDPDIKPKLNMSKEEYRKNEGTAINHFYEKLFLLKNLMNTETGKIIAEERCKYMEEYLQRFLLEVEGNN